MKDLRQKLLATFQVEHKEHLERIRSILSEVEQKGGAPAKADVDEAFRRAHSLKGAARVVDLRSVETLAHRLETLFSRVREGNLHLDHSVAGVVHLVLDAAEDWVSSLAENRPPPDATGALQAVEAVLGMKPQTDTPAETAAPAGPFQILDTVRVNAETLDRLLRSAGQILAEIGRQEAVTQELRQLYQLIGGMEKEWERVRGVASAPLRKLAAAPEFARLSRYLGFIEHELRSLSARVRTARLLQQRSSWSLRHLGEELQQEVKRARMVPAESVYEGFRKMVRNLAQDQGKEIEFRVSGFEVEADRLVLQALKDSLMHLLRNAVSHGIEPPAERISKGKNRVGRVVLRMEAQSNRLLLSVEDDGRGVDLKRVAEVAVRRGLLTETEAGARSPLELARLVFQPGFSTADVVTDFSGRGMGLSVVYEAVARLQGEVEIELREGGGTSIYLSTPLSASTHRLLLVTCRGQTFCIPVHSVERLCRVKVADLETLEGKPVLRLEGKPVPLMRLSQALELGDGMGDTNGEMLPVMVIQSGDLRVAMAVDGFLAERDSFVKDLGIPLPRGAKVAGGILAADGSVALVLSPGALVKAFEQSSGKATFTSAKPAAKEQASTILVVDDSITTRTLEKSILEAHGYDVRVAVDGVEALNQLRADPANLVIADIQMPRMDGFTLLEEMKKDQRLAQTPVIIVSSLERREEQERGLALGADAYIVKRKFDQRELLDTIRQIL